jgi:hypothetical protein
LPRGHPRAGAGRVTGSGLAIPAPTPQSNRRAIDTENMAKSPIRSVRAAIIALACTSVGLYLVAAAAFLAMLWTLFQVLMLFFG